MTILSTARARALIALACLSLAQAGAQTIDKPVATVKLIRQEIYSQRQFKADIERIEAAIKQKVPADARRKIVEGQVNAILFKQYCEREKIIVSEAEVTGALNELKAQLGPGTDDARLEANLRAQGIFTELRAYARQQLLLNRYMQIKKADELKAFKMPTADEILKEYDLQKSNLVRPDTARVSVIYGDLRGLPDADRKKSQALFRDMAAQLRNNPAKFDEYVLRAVDPSAGYKAEMSVPIEKTPQSQSVYGADFLEKVFSLKPGEISGLVEGETGLQIVRFNELLPQKQLTLSDTIPGQANATVQDLIAYQLAQQKQAALVEKLQADLIVLLLKEGTVKIYDENLSF
jgi:parvulin-like peptidyl-prolyl isomerase